MGCCCYRCAYLSFAGIMGAQRRSNYKQGAGVDNPIGDWGGCAGTSKEREGDMRLFAELKRDGACLCILGCRIG